MIFEDDFEFGVPEKKVYEIVEPLEEVQKKRKLQKQKRQNKKRQQQLSDLENQQKEQEKQQQQQKKKKKEDIIPKSTLNLIEKVNSFRNRLPMTKEEVEQQDNDGFLQGPELKMVEQQYEDYCYADFILEFLNPDYKDEKVFKQQYMTFKDAEKVFDDHFSQVSPDQNKTLIRREKRAFLYAFLMLDDYEEKKSDAQIQLEKIKARKAEKQSKAQKKSEEPLKEVEMQNLNESQNEQKPAANKTFGVPILSIMKLTKPTSEKKQKNKALVSAEKWINLIQRQEQLIDEERAKITCDFKALQEHMAQLNKYCQSYFKEVNVEKRINFEDVQKKYFGGGFLKLQMYSETDEGWICTNNSPKDFLTLLRFMTISKLATDAGIHCRPLLSNDGKLILISLKGGSANILREADTCGFYKQIELGYADLMSLEPVDEKFRPLRLKDCVRAEVQNLKKNQKEHDNRKEKPEVQQVEARAKDLIKEIHALEDDDFWERLAEKQLEADNILENIFQDLKIDNTFERAQILDDDNNVTQQQWECYLLYLEYLIAFGKRMQGLEMMAQKEYEQEKDLFEQEQKDKLQQKKNELALEKGAEEAAAVKNTGGTDPRVKFERNYINQYKFNQGFLWRLILQKAITESNETSRYLNGGLFKRTYLFNYWDRLGFDTPLPPYTHFFQAVKQQELSIWRKYQVNEKDDRSIFYNMEKIKLTHRMILKQIDVYRLISSQLLFSYYASHDPFQLNGVKKAGAFFPLKQNKLFKDKEVKKTEGRIKNFFQVLKYSADSSDFDSECLDDETFIQFSRPWYVNIDSIRDYFGEKVALYFQFLSFQSFHLSYMLIIGVILQILFNQDFTNIHAQRTIHMISGLCVFTWSSFFIEYWKRKQSLFAASYGQENYQDDAAKRPAFVGQFRRNITNDKLNQEYYSPAKRSVIIGISIFISFLIMGCVIVCVLLIFALRQYFETCDCYPEIPIFNPKTLQGVLTSIQVVIFNIIYFGVGNRLNFWENHQIVTSYENSFIAKVFMFQFINTFISLFIISYLDAYFPAINLCPADANGVQSCFKAVSSQMSSIFVTNFIMNLPDLLVPFIKISINKLKEKETKPQDHYFCHIDEYLKHQSGLNSYQTNDEIDGTMQDYLQLIVQFAFISLFGVAFPACFSIGFANNIFQLQVDKYKLTKFSKRPIPSGAANIGTWATILDIISFLSIFTIAGSVAYTTLDYPSDESIQVFVGMIITFLAIKSAIKLLIPDIPEEILIIQKRHKTCIDNVVKGFQQQEVKCYSKGQADFNIGCVSYPTTNRNQNFILQGPNVKVTYKKLY